MFITVGTMGAEKEKYLQSRGRKPRLQYRCRGSGGERGGWRRRRKVIDTTEGGVTGSVLYSTDVNEISHLPGWLKINYSTNVLETLCFLTVWLKKLQKVRR